MVGFLTQRCLCHLLITDLLSARGTKDSPNSDQVNSVSAGNVVTAYTPDSTDGMRLAETKTTANGTTVFDENISSNYYANDQRHTETVSRINPGSGTPETHSTTFSYNTQDELTGVTDYLGGGNYSYSYDNAGNRTNLGTANLVNEYPTETYNARGDVVNDGTNAYTWDAKDRLISVTPDNPIWGSTAEQYGYDAQGRLLWEQVSTYACVWNVSSSKEYVWDLNHIVAELDGTNNNALLETYTWGPTGLLAVTTYPSDPNNPNPGITKTYEAVEDASGSVVELLDPTLSTGNVVAAYHYDPFGNLLSSSGVAAAVCPFGFQQMLSDASGKYYDNARWYDPVAGRFLSRDPIAEQGGDNIFAFGQNDPINKADPTGLQAYKPASYVYWEAVAKVEKTYHVQGLLSSQVVYTDWKLHDWTFGELVDWTYEKKVQWYLNNQNTIVGDPPGYVPPGIYADNRTPAQKVFDGQIEYAMRHPEAPPDALTAAQLLRKNDGSLVGALRDATVMKAPDIAAAIAGVAPTSARPAVVGEPGIITVRGQTDVASHRLAMNAQFAGDPPMRPPVPVQRDYRVHQCHLELVRHRLCSRRAPGSKLPDESVPSQNGRFSTRPEVAGFGRPSTPVSGSV